MNIEFNFNTIYIGVDMCVYVDDVDGNSYMLDFDKLYRVTKSGVFYLRNPTEDESAEIDEEVNKTLPF